MKGTKKGKKPEEEEKKGKKLPNTHEEEPNPIIPKNTLIHPIKMRDKPVPKNA